LVPLLRATNISRDLSFDDLVFVPEKRVGSEQWLRTGDIVVASSSGSLSVVGKAARLREAFAGSFGAFCSVVRTIPEASTYLGYFLQTSAYRQWIEGVAAGSNINNLRREHLESVVIPLAPLAEQQRIVAAIEEQLSRVDAGVEALERVKKELARYRSSVLKAACEGRLVPTEAELARAEDRPYEPASELLTRILTERRARWDRKSYTEPAPPDTSELPNLPEGWSWSSVEQLNPVDRPCAYGVLQPGDDTSDGVPFVRVGDIDGGRVAVDQLKKVKPSIAVRYPRTNLRGGEVLLTLVGSIGRTAVVPDSLKGGNVARAVGVLPVAPPTSPRWVEIWLRNPDRVAALTAASHEVARKTLNLEDVRRTPVALPPVPEQHRIIAEVERRLSIQGEVAAVVESALARASRLRQAVLKRAFEGRLVPQDPNDEPANSLLAQIRAERAAAAPEVVPARRKRVTVSDTSPGHSLRRGRSERRAKTR
jgi:type I restriction enzyme S subunit